MSASLKAFKPAFDAQYAAALANAFVPARLLMLMMNPPLTPAQLRDCRMTGVEHAGEIGVDHLGKLFWRHLGNLGEDADARVVDENVETAKSRDGRPDRALHLGISANIRLQRLDQSGACALDSRPGGGQMRRASSRHGDLYSFGHEPPGNREPDTTRTARHKSHLPS